jgi:hypothetical protein
MYSSKKLMAQPAQQLIEHCLKLLLLQKQLPG